MLEKGEGKKKGKKGRSDDEEKQGEGLSGKDRRL
jgi:hypothetical protein